jgi:hypothetical protein
MLLSMAWLITGCGLGRPFHSTPLEALTESPGELVRPELYDADSVVILQRQEIAGGLVLLYRWQTPPSQEKSAYCLATTFVTPEGAGWRAQASGFIADRYPRQPPLLGCEIPSGRFVAGWSVGGNVARLTTAYGLAPPDGAAVRITWSDGQVDSVSLKNSSFLLARPDTLQVQRIELLDADGKVLESQEWQVPQR